MATQEDRNKAMTLYNNRVKANEVLHLRDDIVHLPKKYDAISKSYQIDLELNRLRKGKRGRPYQPCKHLSRAQLDYIRDEELNRLNL
mgnify:CR=1 FL=1